MPTKKGNSISANDASSTARLSRVVASSSLAVFIIVTVVLTAIADNAYMRKLDDLNIFMSGSAYFSECMSVPCGLLNWVGSFLTQFFYYPWAGSLLLTAVLVALWFVVVRSFGIPRRLFALGAVPSVLCLLFLLSIGYVVFMVKGMGFPFLMPLGFMVSAAYYGIYVRIGKAWLRAVAVAAGVLAGYPLFGVFALFGAALCVVGELLRFRSYWPAAVALAAIICWPYGYFYLADNHMTMERLYISGLPYYSGYGPHIERLTAVIFVSMAVMPFIFRRRDCGSRKPMAAIIAGGAVFVASILALVLLRYSDENFRVTLAMDKAIEEERYDDARRHYIGLEGEPTRAIVLLNHIALMHQGTAGDSLFAHKTAAAEYNVPDKNFPSMRMAAARPVYYHFGRIYDAYRWGMEDMVEFGPRITYLKYMTKVALLSGETELAKRYLDKISRTLFYKDWAEKYRAYADNPELMDADAEFSRLAPLRAYVSYIGGDSGLIESYLTSNLVSLNGGPDELLELSLQFNMVQKNIDGFWPRLQRYASTHKRLPRHYQEAIILFSNLEHKVDWQQFNLDKDIVRRFQAFMKLAQSNARMTDEQNREAFGPAFGDTYWFYYFFTSDLETT